MLRFQKLSSINILEKALINLVILFMKATEVGFTKGDMRKVMVPVIRAKRHIPGGFFVESAGPAADTTGKEAVSTAKLKCPFFP